MSAAPSSSVSLRSLLSSVPPSRRVDTGIYESEIAASLDYLASSEATHSLGLDLYWPKWDSPWWHMLALHEMGETKRIPESAVLAMRSALREFPVKIFPLQPADLPQGLDLTRHSACHCMIGNVHQVLAAWGLDVDADLPWIRDWLASYQMEDGGLNCDKDAYQVRGECPSSMVATIAPFEALVRGRRPWTEAERRFLDRGAAFLIGRRLVKGSESKHNAEERGDEEKWKELCFPRFYLFDVLRGLSALTEFAELARTPVPAVAVSEAVAHLNEQFPDGLVKNQRRSIDGKTTLRLSPDGKWQRRQPTASFPLLEKLSAIGAPSPFLTAQWTETRARLLRLIDRGLV